MWSALKTGKFATQDSRVELLESGSSTPVSTGHSDDVDSASVTTSSSSEVTAVTGRRDRGVGLPAPAAVAKPKHSLPPPRVRANHAQDPLAGSMTRSTYFKDKRSVHDNDGFVGDDGVVNAAEDIPYHPLQQRQTPATDAHTHCVLSLIHI